MFNPVEKKFIKAINYIKKNEVIVSVTYSKTNGLQDKTASFKINPYNKNFGDNLELVNRFAIGFKNMNQQHSENLELSIGTSDKDFLTFFECVNSSNTFYFSKELDLNLFLEKIKVLHDAQTINKALKNKCLSNKLTKNKI